MRLSRILTAGALSAGLITGPAVALAPSAGAAVSHGIVYTANNTGWQVTGRQFRYDQAQFTLPVDSACIRVAQQSPSGFGAAIDLNAGSVNTTFGISAVPSATGCGGYSISFASNYTGAYQQFWPVTSVAVFPGDTVRLSLYYNQASTTTYAGAVNLTTGQSTTASFQHGIVYTFADTLAGFGTFGPDPSTDYRLWSFSHLGLTTYTGVRGTYSTLGTAREQVMTSNGTGTGAVEANSPVLYNSGRNFASWVRA